MKNVLRVKKESLLQTSRSTTLHNLLW